MHGPQHSRRVLLRSFQEVTNLKPADRAVRYLRVASWSIHDVASLIISLLTETSYVLHILRITSRNLVRTYIANCTDDITCNGTVLAHKTMRRR